MFAPIVTVDPEQADPMVHEWTAGDPSVFPLGSTARTRNSCAVVVRPEYARGDVQAANALPSSEHWNVEPASVAVNSNDALVEVVPVTGAAVMFVCGATVSTAHSWTAGESST